MTHRGEPTWLQLVTTDPDAARTFYGELFGWTADDEGGELPGYFSFHRPEGPLGGCMASDGSFGPNRWVVYLAADDAEKVVEAAPQYGGQALGGAQAIGDRGVMAMVADPGGAEVAVWQPGTKAGFGPVSPGWFELHTRDYDRTVEFYREVLGWDAVTAADEPGFRYTTNGADDDQVAGIMDASAWPQEAPMGWSAYFEVADADATVARAAELGATVVMAPEATPYGRLATLVDPTGAPFKLRQP